MEGSKTTEWERWESTEVARWDVSSVIHGWKMQGELKISSFEDFILINGTKGTGWVQDVRVQSQGCKNFPWILHKLLKIWCGLGVSVICNCRLI